MAESQEDPRLVRAAGYGANVEGINIDPDAGQAQVQAKADRVEALGYIPSDGTSLGFDELGEETATVEELAEGQKEANKAFTMPPDGLAAEKPVPPHSAEAASSEGSEEEDEEEDNGDVPAKSASRAEWDAYAESQGVDPSQFATKEDLQAHFGVV